MERQENGTKFSAKVVWLIIGKDANVKDEDVNDEDEDKETENADDNWRSQSTTAADYDY